MTNLQKPEILSRNAFLRRIHPLMGGAICVLAALAAATVASGRPWQAWMPLGFSVVPLLTARLFGTRAGILGTLLAAAIFAYTLFSPLGTFHVTDATARANLGWMLLIGIAFSLLFAPAKSEVRRREQRGETTEPSSRAS